MLSNNFVERNSILLRNLNYSDRNITKDTWYSGTGYGFHSMSWGEALIKGHWYYTCVNYKFTTTNQSPTWMSFYHQGGSACGNFVRNPVAGTEYKISSIVTPTTGSTAYTITSGTLYNGESSAISGVTSYYKNPMIYDVTSLYLALRAKNNINSTSALKTWCDSNLEYTSWNNVYDITELVEDTNESKVCLNSAQTLATEFVETDGMAYYSASSTLRNNTWFDSASGVSVYNNSGGGTVVHTRIDASTVSSPFYPEHKYVLQIKTSGTASPGAGGFVATHSSAANKIFIERFVAKVPVGYTVCCAYNAQGTGSSVSFITPTAGTGDWAEYAILYKCGSSGTFSSGGHVYISGTNNTSVTWYLAYVNNCDITTNEDLKYFSVLNKNTVFKTGRVYTNTFDETNILPNGDGSDQTTSMLPSGWSWDTTDVAGNAKASLVQPVNASSGIFGGSLKINPFAKYKISYWVKCKGDMTSFLTAIAYYSGTAAHNHTNTVYVPGTKTTLASALKSGDTTVTLTSGSNWAVRSYSKLGFRSGSTWSTKCYNDIGTFNVANCVKSVSGNVITLSTAYSGDTRAAGTVIVESYNGGTYPYPIGKGNLPTDNTWKYVEGYFGANNTLWDGSGASGWAGIPASATTMNLILNLYSNTGTVPIKYADIRIEEVGTNSGNRVEDRVQFKKES